MDTGILTKDEFWAQQETTFPHAMKVFKEWIDKYKVHVNWDSIFKKRVFDQTVSVEVAWRLPKFHELPIAFQAGIFSQFIIEIGGAKYRIIPDSNMRVTTVEMIIDMLNMIEDKAKNE